MFFHFQLNPIAEIKPWGKDDEPVLHWFGLSDGLYWIQIGETELFRYSKATLAAYSLPPYVDYFVVRLWEDILEIVPTILDPLPTALLQRMESVDTWLSWCKKVDSWRWRFDEDEDEQEKRRSKTFDVRGDLQNEALSWWWSRHLYTGAILFKPGVSFWSDGQFVHCIWDTRSSLDENGIPIWEAVYGTMAIPLAAFMEAVTSFDTRFISAMTERVHTVLADWSRPEIKLDFAQLAQEHVQRSTHFAKRMAEVPARAKTAKEWESVLEAIRAIENDPDFLTMP